MLPTGDDFKNILDLKFNILMVIDLDLDVK
jgi:hypothetical protein